MTIIIIELFDFCKTMHLRMAVPYKGPVKSPQESKVSKWFDQALR